jgi:hypothetical protein
MAPASRPIQRQEIVELDRGSPVMRTSVWVSFAWAQAPPGRRKSGPASLLESSRCIADVIWYVCYAAITCLTTDCLWLG